MAAELERGFGGFGAAGGEEDAAGAVRGFAKIARGKSEETPGEFGGRTIREVRGVHISKSAGLLADGFGDGSDSVADGNDGGASAGVEYFVAVGSEDVAAFGADGFGINFAEAAREEGDCEIFGARRMRLRRCESRPLRNARRF